jgi:hypothetical protein
VTGERGEVTGYLSRGDLVRALRRKIEDETIVEGPGINQPDDKA